jgi:hypothetical protein
MEKGLTQAPSQRAVAVLHRRHPWHSNIHRRTLESLSKDQRGGAGQTPPRLSLRPPHTRCAQHIPKVHCRRSSRKGTQDRSRPPLRVRDSPLSVSTSRRGIPRRRHRPQDTGRRTRPCRCRRNIPCMEDRRTRRAGRRGREIPRILGGVDLTGIRVDGAGPLLPGTWCPSSSASPLQTQHRHLPGATTYHIHYYNRSTLRCSRHPSGNLDTHMDFSVILSFLATLERDA